MRIVDVCAFYAPAGGGVRTYVDAKLKWASRNGHEVIILAPGERDETVKRGPGAFVVTIPSPTLPLDRRYRYFDDEAAIHRVLDAWQPDHVEASSPWSSASMVGRWQGPASRSLIMHCDPLATYAYRWMGGVLPIQAIDRVFGRFWQHLRRLDDMYDLVVCANRQLSRRLDRGGIEKTETIPMGVEPGIFSPSRRSSQLRDAILASMGLEPDAVLLLGLGRFASEKRWEMVLRAAARVPNVGLLLVGDGTRRPQIERMARRAGNVQVAGPISDRFELSRLLASADALVHGCEAETFCMAAAEARASGIPLIVPDRGAAVDHSVRRASVVYRSASEESLERAIWKFVERGPELQRMRATLNSDVRTMDEHFEQLVERYGRLRSTAAVAASPDFDEPVARLASSLG
jgi:alpha-1,6-mannosyltransferase